MVAQHLLGVPGTSIGQVDRRGFGPWWCSSAGRGWERATTRYQRPPGGGLVVVAGGEGADGVGQVVGEGVAVGGGGEAEVGVDGEGAAAAGGARGELADLPDHPAGEGEEVTTPSRRWSVGAGGRGRRRRRPRRPGETT